MRPAARFATLFRPAFLRCRARGGDRTQRQLQRDCPDRGIGRKRSPERGELSQAGGPGMVWKELPAGNDPTISRFRFRGRGRGPMVVDQ